MALILLDKALAYKYKIRDMKCNCLAAFIYFMNCVMITQLITFLRPAVSNGRLIHIISTWLQFWHFIPDPFMVNCSSLYVPEIIHFGFILSREYSHPFSDFILPEQNTTSLGLIHPLSPLGICSDTLVAPKQMVLKETTHIFSPALISTWSHLNK